MTILQTKPEVKSLVKQAHAANLITYRQKGGWLREQIKANVATREVLLAFAKYARWPFSEQSIDEMVKRHVALANAFDSVSNEDPWEQARARWPIKEYCERFLRLRFKNNKRKCPMHDGKTSTSFVIDPHNKSLYLFWRMRTKAAWR